MTDKSESDSTEPSSYKNQDNQSSFINSNYKLSQLKDAPIEKSLSTVILNIGGLKHQILWRNLEKFPNTRLGKISRASTISEIESLCDVLLDNQISEIFFDRNSTTMGLILGFYRTGVLHVDDTICPLAYCDDLKYWQIDEMYIDPCCLIKYNVRKERVIEESGKLMEEDSDNNSSTDPETSEHFVSDTKRKLWYIMEKPYTSTLAKIMNVISISFIVLSLVTMVLSTTEYFSDYENAEDNYPLNIIEAICVIWFTIEYLVRFACCPDRVKFLKSFLNFIDLLAILPYYISLALRQFGGESFTDVKRALHVLRAMRIIRVMKLAHHSVGLQLLGYTFKRSSNALGLILLLMGIIMFIFSNLIYFAEKEANYNFQNSIESFWWATITMTTVGYGDMVPVTPLGKVLGGLCAISGILSLTLPIPILSRSFQFFYKEKMLKKRSYRPVQIYSWNDFN